MSRVVAPLLVNLTLSPASLFFTMLIGQIFEPCPIWVPSSGVKLVVAHEVILYLELIASTKHSSEPYLELKSSSELQWSEGA